MLGHTHTLTVLRETDHGMYLDALELGDVLMPTRYVPEDCQPGDEVEVFLYLDSEDRPVATNELPIVTVGEVGYLEVVSVNDVGAFLDWGLPKDLFVPFREQKIEMEEGRSYLVMVYVDEKSQRIAATSRLDRVISKTPSDFYDGQEVELIIAGDTDLGYKAIVNHTHWGVLYENEVFEVLKRGETMTGYIRKVREDKKLDLTLHRPGYAKVTDLADAIMNQITEDGGTLSLTDKSPAFEISDAFGVSKKVFKKAVGQLYRKKLIVLTDGLIRKA